MRSIMKVRKSNKITERSFEGTETNAHRTRKCFSIVMKDSQELDTVLRTPMYTTDDDEASSSASSSSSSQASDARSSSSGGVPKTVEIGPMSDNIDDDDDDNVFKNQIRSQILLRKTRGNK